jgi:hypothetical protein
MDGEGRLEEIVRSTDWLIRALITAREVDAPEWMIGAGAVRTSVWDRLHGYQSRSELDDIDLAFFEPADLSEEREDQMRTLLETKLPDECWHAKNQAAVHLWYPNGSATPSSGSPRLPRQSGPGRSSPPALLSG